MMRRDMNGKNGKRKIKKKIEPDPGTAAWYRAQAQRRLAADQKIAAQGGIRLHPEHV